MTSEHWSDVDVVVTGGSGFLGQAVVSHLAAAGARAVTVPRSADYDLRRRDDAGRLMADHRPDVVIHLAARVGGIGYNQAHPAELYLDNLLMGTFVVDE